MSTNQDVVLHARITNLHGTESEWKEKQPEFIPDAGEFVIYDADDTHNTPRIKIGDGTTLLTELPFASASVDTDVKLSKPFTLTADFGYYKLDGKPSITAGTEGQDLHSFLQGAFAQEDKTIFSSTPSCGISMSGRSYEIGSTVTPSASLVTNAGTYKYGTYANGEANYNDKTTGIEYTEGTITIEPSSFVLTADTTVTASGTATRSAVTNYPCSNLGSDLTTALASEYKTSKVISSAASATFTGYRYGFAGATTEDVINSKVVRSMTAKKSSKDSMDSEAEALEFTAAKGATKIFFAYPSTRSGTPYFEMFGLAWAENGNFVQQSNIQVADARGTVLNVLQGPADYKLYVWTPAGPLTAESTKLRVWFK